VTTQNNVIHEGNVQNIENNHLHKCNGHLRSLNVTNDGLKNIVGLISKATEDIDTESAEKSPFSTI